MAINYIGIGTREHKAIKRFIQQRGWDYLDYNELYEWNDVLYDERDGAIYIAEDLSDFARKLHIIHVRIAKGDSTQFGETNLSRQDFEMLSYQWLCDNNERGLYEQVDGSYEGEVIFDYMEMRLIGDNKGFIRYHTGVKQNIDE